MGCYLGKMFCKMFFVLQLPCCLCKGNSLKLVYPSISPVMCENLPFTSKHKFRSGQARPGQNGTYVFKSMGGFGQRHVSPCNMDHTSKKGREQLHDLPLSPCLVLILCAYLWFGVVRVRARRCKVCQPHFDIPYLLI